MGLTRGVRIDEGDLFGGVPAEEFGSGTGDERTDGEGEDKDGDEEGEDCDICFVEFYCYLTHCGGLLSAEDR